jgi:hypothetical protein
VVTDLRLLESWLAKEVFPEPAGPSIAIKIGLALSEEIFEISASIGLTSSSGKLNNVLISARLLMSF